MLFNLLIAFLILCALTFIGMGLIFYIGMKANQKDMKKSGNTIDVSPGVPDKKEGSE